MQKFNNIGEAKAFITGLLKEKGFKYRTDFTVRMQTGLKAKFICGSLYVTLRSDHAEREWRMVKDAIEVTRERCKHGYIDFSIH